MSIGTNYRDLKADIESCQPSKAMHLLSGNSKKHAKYCKEPSLTKHGL